MDLFQAQLISEAAFSCSGCLCQTWGQRNCSGIVYWTQGYGKCCGCVYEHSGRVTDELPSQEHRDGQVLCALLTSDGWLTANVNKIGPTQRKAGFTINSGMPILIVDTKVLRLVIDLKNTVMFTFYTVTVCMSTELGV